MSRRVLNPMCAAALLATALAGPVWAAPEEPPLSEANRLLFTSDHLGGLPGAGVLHYRLETLGEGEDPALLVDRIDLDVAPGEAPGHWRVDVHYLTGPRERHVPPVPNAQGNPVIKVFLQRQVVRMSEATGGNWRYFQRAIKLALADDAQVDAVQIADGTDTLQATRITVRPFADLGARLEGYGGLGYRFVLSEQVPGQVYRLETLAPGAGPAADMAESVSFRGFDTPTP